jgi:hypothetical protein
MKSKKRMMKKIFLSWIIIIFIIEIIHFIF